MCSLFQELEEFTLFDGLVPSSGVDCGVEDLFGVGCLIPGDNLVKNEVESVKEELTEPMEDGLFQDWMEITDLSSLLEQSNSELEKSSVQKSNGSSLLEVLLTQPINIKSSPTVSNDSTLCSISSPVPNVIDENQGKDILEEAIEEIHGIDSELLSQQLHDIYNSSLSISDNDLSSENVSLLDNEISPLSPEDIDSILTGSGPSSPNDIFENDPDYSPYQSDEKSNKKSVKTRKSNKKARAIPYDKDAAKVDRKERKKVQNRNAALRYREKKRHERGNIHEEEDGLLGRNTELKTKVEHLQNEINYMKNLLTEVCEARGLKIQFK